jgi:hypothetical protein
MRCEPWCRLARGVAEHKHVGVRLLLLALPAAEFRHEAGHGVCQLVQLHLQLAAAVATAAVATRLPAAGGCGQVLQLLAGVRLLLQQQRDVVADDGAHAAAMLLQGADAAQQQVLLRARQVGLRGGNAQVLHSRAGRGSPASSEVCRWLHRGRLVAAVGLPCIATARPGGGQGGIAHGGVAVVTWTASAAAAPDCSAAAPAVGIAGH